MTSEEAKRDRIVQRLILLARFETFLSTPTLKNMGRVMNAMSLYIPTRFH